jgi:two-component system response regulator AtoC
MARRRVLIVDDEEGIRTSLELVLADEGYGVRTCGDPDEALRIAGAESFDVILCDVRMPRRSGLDLLPDLVRLQPEATILVMSAYGDLEQALEAVRRGAYDYLAKPFQPAELLVAIRKAEERERLRRENRRLRAELGEGRRRRALVGASSAMRQVLELVEQAALYKTTVLVTGESGVGKELVARAIHELGDRGERPFIAVNCGAIPESLIESELFGHARGAFTGADASRLGLFREADGGTLFLDEIGELPLAMQVKLLRVLQEEEVRPIGEPKPLPVDVRILAATARDLESDVAKGIFRGDLYYRLNVFRIHVPPLRERREDIPLLVDHLVETLSRRIRKRVSGVDPDVLERLTSYPWPGNVRELENLLARAIILARGERLTLEALPHADAPERPPGDAQDLSIKRGTRALEERLIRRALEQTGGNRTRAARILEISARALQYKLKDYGIAPLNPRSGPADSA